MRAVKGSCKIRSSCRHERECVRSLWAILIIIKPSDGLTGPHTPISGFKTLQNENANWISCSNNSKIAAWTQPAQWSPGKHSAWKIKNSGRLNSKGFYLREFPRAYAKHILLNLKPQLSFTEFFSFHPLCVKSEGSIYLSLDPRSLPGPRNWSTLENIWDFTTLGSHILHRGGILCPLSGGDCLYFLHFLFCGIFATKHIALCIQFLHHFYPESWRCLKTFTTALNGRLTHGFSLLMKNNAVLRTANDEGPTLACSLFPWNINIRTRTWFYPSNVHETYLGCHDITDQSLLGGQGRISANFLSPSL